MKSRIVPICDLTDVDVRAWRDLAEHAIEPNPVFEAECLIPAAQHLPNGNQILIAIAEEEGRFFGCFPIVWVGGNQNPSNTWSGIRRPAFSTQVRRMRYDGTPLLRQERGIEAAKSLLGVFAQRNQTKRAGILVLEAFDIDGPVCSYFESAAKELNLTMYAYRTWTRPMVRRRGELNYRDIHGGPYLKRMRRMRRQLGEELGGDVQTVDRSADASAVDKLIEIEAAGYKAKAGTALVSQPGEPEWFRKMCEHFRAADRVLFYSLQVEDTIVAMQLMLRAGEGLFSLQSVYDENFAKFSPGNQLDLEVIDNFHLATDAMWLDTCTFEGNRALQRLYPDVRNIATFLIAVGGPIDRFLLRLSVVGQKMLGVDSKFRLRYPRVSAAIDWIFSRVVLHHQTGKRS